MIDYDPPHIPPPQIDTDMYLHRLRCRRERTPSFGYLKMLHRAHLYHIPFENLDVFMGKEITLDIKKIYEKIVLNNRGGFCYELNGLFYQLLFELGFDCHLISIQVFQADGSLSPPYDHAAIVVTINDQQYLIDVGYGDFFIDPKAIIPLKVQMDYNRYYRIDKNIDDEYTVHQSEDSFTYRPIYQFSLKKRQFIEFIERCKFHQTNEQSRFMKGRFITKAIKGGRMTLSSTKWTSVVAGKEEVEVLRNDEEYDAKLLRHFGVKFERFV